MDTLDMGLDQDTVLRLLLSQRAMLMGYILSIVRDAHLAEDVFQNVSLLVVKKSDSLQDEGSFPIWARKAARFEALNTLRKAERGAMLLDDAILDSLEAHWSAKDAAAPASVLALQGCLKKLTPRARQLVDLRYGEGLSGHGLAAKLTQPLNSVYVALSRIHRTLGECVRRQLTGEGLSHG